MGENRTIEDLQRRVRMLEDYIALYQSLSTYGPAADAMEVGEAAGVWEVDGVYDLGDGHPDVDQGRGMLVLNSREEIGGILRTPVHGRFMDRGCAHAMSQPLLGIDGDRALGIGYHRVYAHTEAGAAEVAKLSASRIEWRRQESGEWLVSRRTHRLIDGREAGRALLRDSLREIQEMRRRQDSSRTESQPIDATDGRMQVVEDRLDITELMTVYALAVDADDWDRAANLWLSDGVYELEGIGIFTGPAGVKEMLTRPAHTFAREHDGAHLVGQPVILLDGDRAVATTYGQILTRESGHHRVFRLIIARWELRRTADGWRVARRVNKLVDNAGDARALARAASSWEWPATSDVSTNNIANGDS